MYAIFDKNRYNLFGASVLLFAFSNVQRITSTSLQMYILSFFMLCLFVVLRLLFSHIACYAPSKKPAKPSENTGQT